MCKCAECGTSFKRRQSNQIFCKPACKTSYWNRMGKRGKVLAPLAIAAREKRNSTTAKWAMTERDRLVALWRDEDKAAGRLGGHELIRLQQGFKADA